MTTGARTQDFGRTKLARFAHELSESGVVLVHPGTVDSIHIEGNPEIVAGAT